MAYRVRELKEGLGFGREVVGLTPDDIKQPQMREELRRYWADDGLILFRESLVTPQFQVELSELFGLSEIHPLPEFRAKEDERLVNFVSDKDEEGLFEVDDVPSVAFLPWHFDLAYMDKINRGGLLTALSITSWGGQTGFRDRLHAYDLLPEALKKEVESLEVVYQLLVNPGYSRYGTRSKVKTIRTGNFERSCGPRVDQDYPPVVHPIVCRHEGTGRKVLNISPFGALYVLGHDDDYGHDLLQRLVDHLDSCPAYFHAWQPNEMILWDNWRMLHCVTGAPPEERRVVRRTTIAGDYGMGRKLVRELA